MVRPLDPAKNTVLVTGGAGFIGSNLVACLVADADLAVVNLDLLTYAGHLESLALVQGNPHHHFVQGDIADAELVRSLLAANQPIAVFNLAAESHVDRSIDSPDEFVRTNVVGTAQLLREVLAYWERLDDGRRRDFRFLHVSTDEVYGSAPSGCRFSETAPYRPTSPYAASKAAADHLAAAYHRTYGLPTIVSNCTNNYGPLQFPEKLIPLTLLNALEGKSLPVYGDGRYERDWLYVADHCDALMALWRKGRPGEAYHVGSGLEWTNIDVVRRICRIIDELGGKAQSTPSDTLIAYVADRPGHDHRYALDMGKISAETGWRPRVGFDVGLRRTVEWYLANQAWVRAVSSDADRSRRGLPRRG